MLHLRVLPHNAENFIAEGINYEIKQRRNKEVWLIYNKLEYSRSYRILRKVQGVERIGQPLVIQRLGE